MKIKELKALLEGADDNADVLVRQVSSRNGKVIHVDSAPDANMSEDGDLVLAQKLKLSICSAHQVADPDCRLCNVSLQHAELDESDGMTVLADVPGMGAPSLPGRGFDGSGDVPMPSGERKPKRRNKRKIRTFGQFTKKK